MGTEAIWEFTGQAMPVLALLTGLTGGFILGVLFIVAKLIRTGHTRCLTCFHDGKHSREEHFGCRTQRPDPESHVPGVER